MPHFINKDKTYIISTSYKVGFSKLRDERKIVKVRSKSELLSLIVNNRKFLSAHYFIARDPYQRIQSLFTDKFRYYPIAYMQEQKPLTMYHRHILSALNLPSDSPFDVIKNKLLSITFEYFINTILPKTYNLDPHSHPQYLSKRIPIIRSININMPMDTKIFKLENPDDMSFLSELTSIDFSSKVHSTSTYADDTTWTKKMFKVVYNIYSRDFKELNYSPESVINF